MQKITILQKFIDATNLFKIFIGTNYMTMPFAFYQSGIVLGIIMLIFVCALNAHCCNKIVKCKYIIISKFIKLFEEKYQKNILPESEAELIRSGTLKGRLEEQITLGHIGKNALGKPGQWIVTIGLFVCQFGFCTGYFIFIGNMILELITSKTSIKQDSSNITSIVDDKTSKIIENDKLLLYLIIAPLPLFVLFSLMRTIRKMGYISMLALISIAFSYFSILGILFQDFSISSEFQWANFKSVPVMFGILTASIEGIGAVIPIETSMIGNRQNFSKYLHITMILLSCILGTFGVVSHLKFGSNTKQIISQNLPNTNLVFAINTILVISVICTFPLQMFPIVEIVEFLFFRQRTAQFNKDRGPILSSHDIIDMELNVEYQFQDLFLDQLTNNESDNEINNDVEKIINENNKLISNSISNKLSRSDYSLPKKQSDSKPDEKTKLSLDLYYNKEEWRMLRVLYGTKIRADTWKRNIVRISIVFLQLGLALAMRNNFAYLASFNGSVGGCILCYVFPAVTHYILTKKPKQKWYCNIGDIFIALFGIVGSIAAFVVTIYQMTEEY